MIMQQGPLTQGSVLILLLDSLLTFTECYDVVASTLALQL